MVGPYKNYFNVSRNVILEQNETRSIVLHCISRASATLSMVLLDSCFVKILQKKKLKLAWNVFGWLCCKP
jgi:hypothetical protein